MPQKPDEVQTKNQVPRLLAFEPKTPCSFCEGQNTAKAGQRTKREGKEQKYYCKTCKKYFSSSPMPHKTYSPKVILNGITYYNTGHKLDATRKKLNS
jgi:transposase-like protein